MEVEIPIESAGDLLVELIDQVKAERGEAKSEADESDDLCFIFKDFVRIVIGPFLADGTTPPPEDMELLKRAANLLLASYDEEEMDWWHSEPREKFLESLNIIKAGFPEEV